MKSEQLVLALIAVVVGVLGWQTYQRFAGRHVWPSRPMPAATAAAAATPLVLRVFSLTSGAESDIAADVRASTPSAAPAAPPETTSVAVVYTAHDLRDPFLSALPQEPEAARTPPKGTPVVRLESPPNVHLQGVMYGNGVARAIIDGQIVGEGDYISQVQVIQIMRDGVVLGTPTYRFLLRTNNASKK